MPTLAELAEDAAAYTPLWPGVQRVDDPRFCVLFLEHMTFVQRLRLDADGVDEALADVRTLAGERGRRSTVWWLGESTEPRGLRDRLVELGLEPLGEPLLGMACAAEPRADVTVPVREAGCVDDYRTSLRIEQEVNSLPSDDRALYLDHAEENWRRVAGSQLRHYLAELDGSAVAMGRAAFGDAVFLMGGATLPQARGRGAYTSLVTERWRQGGGRPLVVQAAPDSQPILARLGFESVGPIHVLRDGGDR
jgi:hypothetical protein